VHCGPHARYRYIASLRRFIIRTWQAQRAAVADGGATTPSITSTSSSSVIGPSTALHSRLAALGGAAPLGAFSGAPWGAAMGDGTATAGATSISAIAEDEAVLAVAQAVYYIAAHAWLYLEAAPGDAAEPASAIDPTALAVLLRQGCFDLNSDGYVLPRVAARSCPARLGVLCCACEALLAAGGQLPPPPTPVSSALPGQGATGSLRDHFLSGAAAAAAAASSSATFRGFDAVFHPAGLPLPLHPQQAGPDALWGLPTTTPRRRASFAVVPCDGFGWASGMDTVGGVTMQLRSFFAAGGTGALLLQAALTARGAPAVASTLGCRLYTAAGTFGTGTAWLHQRNDAPSARRVSGWAFPMHKTTDALAAPSPGAAMTDDGDAALPTAPSLAPPPNGGHNASFTGTGTAMMLAPNGPLLLHAVVHCTAPVAPVASAPSLDVRPDAFDELAASLVGWARACWSPGLTGVCLLLSLQGPAFAAAAPHWALHSALGTAGWGLIGKPVRTGASGGPPPLESSAPYNNRLNAGGVAGVGGFGGVAGPHQTGGAPAWSSLAHALAAGVPPRTGRFSAASPTVRPLTTQMPDAALAAAGLGSLGLHALYAPRCDAGNGGLVQAAPAAGGCDAALRLCPRFGVVWDLTF
jgi:hypothetical protein